MSLFINTFLDAFYKFRLPPPLLSYEGKILFLTASRAVFKGFYYPLNSILRPEDIYGEFNLILLTLSETEFYCC